MAFPKVGLARYVQQLFVGREYWSPYKKWRKWTQTCEKWRSYQTTWSQIGMTFSKDIVLMEEILNNHLGFINIISPVNNGIINYQPQLVSLPNFWTIIISSHPIPLHFASQSYHFSRCTSYWTWGFSSKIHVSELRGVFPNILTTWINVSGAQNPRKVGYCSRCCRVVKSAVGL